MGKVLVFDQVAPLLRAIPSLPRPLLAQLTERMIDRLDELDGDVDLEDGDEDCCPAGDDHVGQSHSYLHHGDGYPGDADDAEDDLEDCCSAGDDRIMSGPVNVMWGARPSDKPGSDEDAEADGAQHSDAVKSREVHRGRIRRTRCVPILSRDPWSGRVTVEGHRLSHEPSVPSMRSLRRQHPHLKRGKRKR